MNCEENIVKIALYISCNDGVLSEEEEVQLVKSSIALFPSIKRESIGAWIEDFFSEDVLLEVYCARVASKGEQLKAIKIAIEAASADGLDPKENLALNQVINLWDIAWEDIAHA